MPAAESSNPVIVLLPDGSIRLYHEPLLQVADVLRGFPCHSLASLNQPLQENSAADPIAGATRSTAAADSHSPKPASINVIPPPVAAAAATASSSGGSPVAGTSAGLLFPAASAPKPPREPAVPAPLPRDQFLQPGGTYALFRPAALARAASAAFAESSSSSLRFEWITDSRSDHSRATSGAMGRREAPIQDPRLIKATRHHEPPADVTRSARADSEWEPDDDVMRAMIPPAAAVSCFMPVSSRKPDSTTEDPQRVADDEAQGAGAASNHPCAAESFPETNTAASLRRTRSSVGRIADAAPTAGSAAAPPAYLPAQASAAPLISPRGLLSASSRKLVRALTALPRPRLSRNSDVRAAADRRLSTFLAAYDGRTGGNGGGGGGDGGGDAASRGGCCDGGSSSFSEGAGPWSLIDFLSPREKSAEGKVKRGFELPAFRGDSSGAKGAVDGATTTVGSSGKGKGRGARESNEVAASALAAAAFTSDWASQMAEFIGASSASSASAASVSFSASSLFSASSGAARNQAFIAERQQRVDLRVQDRCSAPTATEQESRASSVGRRGGTGSGGGGGGGGGGQGNGPWGARRAFSGLLLPVAVSSGVAEEAGRGNGDGRAAAKVASADAAQFKSLRLQVARPSGAAVMGEHGEMLDAVGPRTTGSRSSGTGWAFSAGERSGDKANAGARVGGAGGWQAGSFSTGSSGGGTFGVGITGRDGVAAAWEALGSSRSGVRGAREERDGFLRYAGERGGAGSGESERAGEGATRDGGAFREGLRVRDGMRYGRAAVDGSSAVGQISTTTTSPTSPGHGSSWVMDWFSPSVLSAPSTPRPLLPRPAVVTPPLTMIPRGSPTEAFRAPPLAPPVRVISSSSSTTSPSMSLASPGAAIAQVSPNSLQTAPDAVQVFSLSPFPSSSSSTVALSLKCPPPNAFLLSPPIACSLSLPSPSSLPSRRLLALPPVTFFSPLPSPSRSLPRCLRDLPPVDCALSLPSPSRSLPRGLLALRPIAWALSLPSPLQFPLSSRRPLHLLSLTSSLPVGIALTFLPPLDIALTSSRPVVRLLSPIPSFASSLPSRRSPLLPSHPIVRFLSPPIPSFASSPLPSRRSSSLPFLPVAFALSPPIRFCQTYFLHPFFFNFFQPQVQGYVF
ncbi:unnamed protein product [Closterium sp. Naga37s-1]|nr:unnamed protein product [Closterium sp. Naga37s-1]